MHFLDLVRSFTRRWGFLSKQVVAMKISLSSRNIMELFRFLDHEITSWKPTKEDDVIDRSRHTSIKFAVG